MNKIRHHLTDIKENPKNYKVCSICGSFNLQENIKCHNCRNRNYFDFKTSEKEVLDLALFQIAFLIAEDGKSEKEIKETTVPVATEKRLIKAKKISGDPIEIEDYSKEDHMNWMGSKRGRRWDK